MATLHIYRGPWINWTHGSIVGATVTLSERDGGLLISFVATFVTIVGAQLWRIISFISHQSRSSRRPQDGLHYQQQIIFRNASTPGGAAWSFFQQLYYWRGKAATVTRRTLPWALFSIIYLLFFGLLAVFSSQISKSTGNARLIQGGNCGYWTVDDSNSTEALQAYNQKMANESIVSSTYARACYGGSHSKLQCATFPVGAIEWSAQTNASCPFQSGICVYGDTAAFKMTSKKIDSHLDLGINAPARNRIQLIKETTCAPLIQLRRSVNGSSRIPGMGRDGDTLLDYFYGGVSDFNYTWRYNTHAYLDQIPYTAYSIHSLAPHDGPGGWSPLDDLRRSDADLSLIFIAANTMRFKEPCDDPVFGAHYETLTLAGTHYEADEFAVPISCAERYQVCNPKTERCTDMVGSKQIVSASRLLALDDLQTNEVIRVSMALMQTNIHHQTFTRLSGALRAQETASGLNQPPLPINQWEIEVSSWFDAGLSRLQHLIQEYATGPTNVVPGSRLWQPGKEGHAYQQAMCDSQLVNDADGTMSFSVLGLIVVFVVGGFIILTSFVLDIVVGWWQNLFNKGETKKLDWLLDDKLLLQRMLFEGSGLGSWQSGTGFPVTTTPENLRGWELDYGQHRTLHSLNGKSPAPERREEETVPNLYGPKSTDVFVRQLP
jgi:hypothetical protein